jgi:uncharacterized membrane protein YphA (DoxX/SURF4 family)
MLVALLARLTLAGVLLTAFVLKVFSSHEGELGFGHFAALIAAHGLFSLDWSPVIAALVLGAESTIGVALVVPIASRVSSWLAILLLTSFSLYLIIVFRHQGVVDCGCFGKVHGGDLSWSIARNTLLASLGGISAIYAPRSPSPRQPVSVA